MRIESSTQIGRPVNLAEHSSWRPGRPPAPNHSHTKLENVAVVSDLEELPLIISRGTDMNAAVYKQRSLNPVELFRGAALQDVRFLLMWSSDSAVSLEESMDRSISQHFPHAANEYTGWFKEDLLRKFELAKIWFADVADSITVSSIVTPETVSESTMQMFSHWHIDNDIAARIVWTPVSQYEQATRIAYNSNVVHEQLKPYWYAHCADESALFKDHTAHFEMNVGDVCLMLGEIAEFSDTHGNDSSLSFNLGSGCLHSGTPLITGLQRIVNMISVPEVPDFLSNRVQAL